MLMLIILFHNIAPLLSPPLLLTISLNEREREETCWIIAWINIRLALHSQLRRTDCSSSSSSSESSIDYGRRQLAANKVKRKSLPMYMQHNNCPDYIRKVQLLPTKKGRKVEHLPLTVCYGVTVVRSSVSSSAKREVLIFRHLQTIFEFSKFRFLDRLLYWRIYKFVLRVPQFWKWSCHSCKKK